MEEIEAGMGTESACAVCLKGDDGNGLLLVGRILTGSGDSGFAGQAWEREREI